MSNKNTLFIFCFFVFCFAFSNNCFSQNCPTTNVRGRVVTNSYNQQIPFVSAKVDLYYFDAHYPAGQQWRLILTTYTDAYGLYYFNNVIPNTYTIWINQVKSYNIKVTYIDCAHNSFLDIPQLIF